MRMNGQFNWDKMEQLLYKQNRSVLLPDVIIIIYVVFDFVLDNCCGNNTRVEIQQKRQR